MGAQRRSETGSRNTRGRPDDFTFNAEEDRQGLARLRAVDARFREAAEGRDLDQVAKAQLWRKCHQELDQLAMWSREELGQAQAGSPGALNPETS